MFLGLIVFLVGFGTKGNSPNIYFIIIGAVILSPFVIYYFYDNYKSKRLIKSNNKQLEDFKNRANKIVVNLEDVQIKSNSWTEQKVIDNSYYAGFNQMAGYDGKNFETITRNFNYVKFKIPHEYGIIEYKAHIPMDTTKLKIYFAIKKQTYLYVDKLDEEKMYLDLDFLFK